MKVNYEKHGVEAIKNLLYYLSMSEEDMVDSDGFEVIGEDEEGREGCAYISIVNLAEEAYNCIADLQNKILKEHQNEI